MAAVGRIVDGRYVVEAELGSGGMGVVLKVRHRFTGATHALKMLRPDFALDAEAQNRFLAEARAANAIGHHGIVGVIDAGKTPEGELYLVMELLAGQPLRAALTRTGIPPQDLRRIGLELLDALGAAHARGFVHRDLKPENVFLCAPNGTVKLLDFGIAKIAAGIAMTSAPRTAAGVVLGTLAYMAPEQLHDARSVDPRADLWAIGAMFFEMLTGRLPWPQRTMHELYIALESEQPTPIQTYLPAAPAPIVAFFARALARDPRARFQTTAEMAAALAALPLVASAPNANQTQMTGGAWSAPVAVTQHTGATAHPQARPAVMTALPPRPPTAPVVAPPPPAIAMPTANVAAPPAGSSSKTWIALGLAVVAVGLIATAIVIAKRDGGHTEVAISETKPPPEKHIVEDKGQTVEIKHDDPAPTPTPPPPPPPQKKTVPPPQAPPKKADPPPQPAGEVKINGFTREGFCDASCRMATQCGMPVNNCMQACIFNERTTTCAKGIRNCNDYAACVFEANCNAAPRGGLTCGQTMQCMMGCGNNNACACNCAAAMSINHAQLLLQFFVCAVNCGGAQECIQQRCGQLTAACLAQ